MSAKRSDEDTQPGIDQAFEPAEESARETGVRRTALPGEREITLADVFREAKASKEIGFTVQEKLRDLQSERASSKMVYDDRDRRFTSQLDRLEGLVEKLERDHDTTRHQQHSLGTKVGELEQEQLAQSIRIDDQDERINALKRELRELNERLDKHGPPAPTDPSDDG